MKYKWLYKTPEEFSDIILTCDDKYLTGLFFADSWDANKSKGDFVEQETPVIIKAEKWLDIYFDGEIPDFTPEYRIEDLTPFRKEVIDIMLCVPYGEVITYGEIAKRLAVIHGIKKMSAQAVGGAVGWNPLCLIVPCHRVIGADGSLTGYGGGMKNKVALLKSERHDMSKFYIPKK